MTGASDRPLDWVAVLAYLSGAAVVVPSVIAVGIALLAVVIALV